jgi:hypothetical protein
MQRARTERRTARAASVAAMPLLAVDPRHGETLVPLEQAPVVRNGAGRSSVFLTYAESESDGEEAPEAPDAAAAAAADGDELAGVARQLAEKRAERGDVGDQAEQAQKALDTFLRSCACTTLHPCRPAR